MESQVRMYAPACLQYQSQVRPLKPSCSVCALAIAMCKIRIAQYNQQLYMSRV
jgi:hypothetical protein